MTRRHWTCTLIFTIALIAIPVTSGAPRQSRPQVFDGRLQAAEVDEFDNAAGEWKSRRILLLNTADGLLLELKDAPDELVRSRLGRQVRLSGFRQGRQLTVEHVDAIETPPAAALVLPDAVSSSADTLGAQKTLVGLFNFSDVQTRPFTLDSIKDKILLSAKSTDNFLKENSYGKMWLDVDFYDWRTLPWKSTDICPGST